MANMLRNTVTTLASITAAAWIAVQGYVGTGYRVAGMVGMFIFLKWLTLDTWDYIRYLVRVRRREHDG